MNGRWALRATRRRGLTLIEVMVAVAVVAVLMALMIPPMLAAREAARRAQCTGNLKQLIVGLINYISTCDTLPPSHLLGPGRANTSALLLVLPFMEGRSLHAAYNVDLESWDPANATVVSTRISHYLCPSSVGLDTPASAIQTHRAKPYPGNSTFAPGHYGVNWGGVRVASGRDATVAYKTPYSGLMLTVVDPDAPPGTVLKPIGLRDMTDGMANTIALAERLDGFGWAVGGWGGSEFDVNLSPNNPGRDPSARRAFTGSVHPGGINIGLADGSIRFLRGSVARPLWHGLITRAGGETIKHDDF